MMGNMGGMMKKVQEMQAKMQQMQKDLENKTVEAESGGGMVKIAMNGKQVVQSIDIDPSLLSADEKEVLEDLIKAALNQAKE
jgi:DNA-binding YbaB/EbfC family protein